MTNRTRGRRVVRKDRTGLWLVLGGLGGAAALVITLFLVFGGRNNGASSSLNDIPDDAANAERIGQQQADEGQQHVPQTQRVEYKTNPPTSGSHWDTPAPWRIYADTPPADETLVHNLEHGGVIISYNKDLVTPEELGQLEDVYAELAAKNPRVLLVSRAAMQNKVTLTAWTYLLRLDTVDLDQIRKFYNGHIARGPECQNGQCPF